MAGENIFKIQICSARENKYCSQSLDNVFGAMQVGWNIILIRRIAPFLKGSRFKLNL